MFRGLCLIFGLLFSWFPVITGYFVYTDVWNFVIRILRYMDVLRANDSADVLEQTMWMYKGLLSTNADSQRGRADDYFLQVR